MTDDTARPPLDVETLAEAERVIRKRLRESDPDSALFMDGVEEHAANLLAEYARLQAESPAQERKITSTDQMEAEQRGLPIPYSEAGSPAQEPWPLTCCAGAVTHAPDCPTGINANPYATATGTVGIADTGRTDVTAYDEDELTQHIEERRRATAPTDLVECPECGGAGTVARLHVESPAQEDERLTEEVARTLRRPLRTGPTYGHPPTSPEAETAGTLSDAEVETIYAAYETVLAHEAKTLDGKRRIVTPIYEAVIAARVATARAGPETLVEELRNKYADGKRSDPTTEHRDLLRLLAAQPVAPGHDCPDELKKDAGA